MNNTQNVQVIDDMQDNIQVNDDMQNEQLDIEVTSVAQGNTNEENTTKPFNWKLWAKNCILDSIPGLLVLAAILFFTTRAYVSSGSMETTLMTGDTTLFWNTRLPYTAKRGQIVGFDFGDEVYIKRIIGLPGETISFKDGYVYINGEKLQEDYLDKQGITYAHYIDTYEIPEDSVFVMGDNRLYSFDARFWDDPFIKVDDIKMFYACTLMRAKESKAEVIVPEISDGADWED